MKPATWAVTLLVTSLLTANAFGLDKHFDARKIAESEIDPLALTINGRFGQSINGNAFQQDAVASHNGYQYLSATTTPIGRSAWRGENSRSGEWQVIRFDDYHFEGDDAHNTISIGIAPGEWHDPHGV